VKYFIDYGFYLSTNDSQELLGNCVLVQSCTLSDWTVFISIWHAARSSSYMVDSLRMMPSAPKCVGVANQEV
jgi:hypothetical protein